jgi:hypothetical protein
MLSDAEPHLTTLSEEPQVRAHQATASNSSDFPDKEEARNDPTRYLSLPLEY